MKVKMLKQMNRIMVLFNVNDINSQGEYGNF